MATLVYKEAYPFYFFMDKSEDYYIVTFYTATNFRICIIYWF